MRHGDIATTMRNDRGQRVEAHLAPLRLQKFVIAECDYQHATNVRYPGLRYPPSFCSRFIGYTAPASPESRPECGNELRRV